MPRGDLFNEQRLFSMVHIDPVEHVPRSRLPPSHHSLLRESDHTAWVSSKVRRRKSGTIMFGPECPAFVFSTAWGEREKEFEVNFRCWLGNTFFFLWGAFFFFFFFLIWFRLFGCTTTGSNNILLMAYLFLFLDIKFLILHTYKMPLLRASRIIYDYPVRWTARNNNVCLEYCEWHCGVALSFFRKIHTRGLMQWA